MLLDLMFIQKEENNDIKKFKKCFSKIIIFEKKTLRLGREIFNYTIQKSAGEKGIRLKVSSVEDRCTKKEADKISNLKKALVKGVHRSEYHIVLIFDGSSEYYCNKLVKMMSVFERKLRQFIYLNVLDVYGKNWVKETLSKDIQEEVNKNEHNKNRHIEMALECFTFQSYIDYLFTKRAFQNEAEVIKEAKSALLERSGFSRKEVIKILDKGEKVSLWERLFKGLDIDFDEKEINKIRTIRNLIMHNKELSEIEFPEYKQLLRRGIKKLDEGISIIERKKYTTSVIEKNIFRMLVEKLFIEAIGEIKGFSNLVFETVAPTLSSNKISEVINYSETYEEFNKTIVKNYLANIASSNSVSFGDKIIELLSLSYDSNKQLQSTVNEINDKSDSNNKEDN